MKHQHALSINQYSAYKQSGLTSVENLAVHPRIQAIGGLSECRIGPGNFETLLSQAPVDYLPPKRRSSQTARSSLLMAVFWQRFSPRDALSDQLRQVYSTGGLAKNVTVFALELIGKKPFDPMMWPHRWLRDHERRENHVGAGPSTLSLNAGDPKNA